MRSARWRSKERKCGSTQKGLISRSRMSSGRTSKWWWGRGYVALSTKPTFVVPRARNKQDSSSSTSKWVQDHDGNLLPGGLEKCAQSESVEDLPATGACIADMPSSTVHSMQRRVVMCLC